MLKQKDPDKILVEKSLLAPLCLLATNKCGKQILMTTKKNTVANRMTLKELRSEMKQEIRVANQNAGVTQHSQMSITPKKRRNVRRLLSGNIHKHLEVPYKVI